MLNLIRMKIATLMGCAKRIGVYNYYVDLSLTKNNERKIIYKVSLGNAYGYIKGTGLS